MLKEKRMKKQGFRGRGQVGFGHLPGQIKHERRMPTTQNLPASTGAGRSRACPPSPSAPAWILRQEPANRHDTIRYDMKRGETKRNETKWNENDWNYLNDMIMPQNEAKRNDLKWSKTNQKPQKDKTRNETSNEAKRHGTTRNETKRHETKRNETKRNETKRNETQRYNTKCNSTKRLNANHPAGGRGQMVGTTRYHLDQQVGHAERSQGGTDRLDRA